MSNRRLGLTALAAAAVQVGVVVGAPFIPPAGSSWLGLVALVVALGPLGVQVRSRAAVAVGHLGLVASCFAFGWHEGDRLVWLTLLAAFLALPLAWAFRRSGRVAKAAAGVLLSAFSFGIFVWSTERIGDGPLSAMPQMLLWASLAGIVMIFQALRRATPPTPAVPAAPPPGPPPEPARAPWGRNVG